MSTFKTGFENELSKITPLKASSHLSLKMSRLRAVKLPSAHRCELCHNSNNLQGVRKRKSASSDSATHWVKSPDERLHRNKRLKNREAITPHVFFQIESYAPWRRLYVKHLISYFFLFHLLDISHQFEENGSICIWFGLFRLTTFWRC